MKRICLICAIIPATLIIIVSALIMALKLDTVHQFAISRVNKAIPGTISLGSLKLYLLDLRAVIRDLEVADPTGRPLAGIKKIEVDVSTRSLLRRKLVVEKVLVEKPEASLELDSAGQLSLLSAFPAGDTSPKEEKDEKTDGTLPVIELKKLNISDGNILFKSDKDSLSARICGLSLKANGETGTFSGRASVTIDSVSVQRSGGNLDVSGIFVNALMREMNLDSVELRLSTDSSVLAVNGRALSLDKDPEVGLSLDADLVLKEFLPIMGLEDKLSGNSRISLKLGGKVSNPDLYLDVKYAGGKVWGYPLQSVFLRGEMKDRIFDLVSLHVDAPVGGVDIKGRVDLRGMFPDGLLSSPGSLKEPVYKLSASVRGVSLKELSPGISGTATASVDIDGQGFIPDSLSAKLGLSARVASLKLSGDKTDGKNLPLDAAVSCSVSVADNIALIHKLKGNLGGTGLALTGRHEISSGKTDADLRLSLTSLGELMKFAGTDSVRGKADVSVHAGGDLKKPVVDMAVNAEAVSYGSIRVGNIALDAGLGKNGVAEVKKLEVINRNSHLMVSGTAKVLDKGRVLPSDQMTFGLSLTSENIEPGDFLDSIGGSVKLNTQIEGTVNDPVGHVKLSASRLSAAGQSIASVTLDAILAQQRLNIQPLNVTISSGQDLTIKGWASLKDSFSVALSAPGIKLKTISALSSQDSLDGTIFMDLQAGGTYKNPQAGGSVGVKGIKWGTLRLEDILLQLALSDQQVNVKGRVLGDVSAGYNLGTRDFSASLEINDLLLTPYLAITGQSLEGSLTVAVKAAGNSDSLDKITGSLEIADLKMSYKSIPVIEVQGLRAAFEEYRYSIPDFIITLAGEGSIKGHAEGHAKGPHDIALNGMVPLTVARYFSPDIPDIEGRVFIDASLKGTPENPDLKATVKLRDIAMTVPGLTQRLHSLNGDIIADPKRVRIVEIKGKLDDGGLGIKGELELDNLAPSDLSVDIALDAVPAGVPDMLDIVIGGKLHMSGTPDTSQITGDIVLLDGLYYKDISINPLGIVGGERKRKVKPPPAEYTAPYIRNMRFDIGVQTRSAFRVDNNMARLTVAPDIQVMGTLQTPSVSGRAVVEQGVITYLKKEFTVDRGIIDFVNPYAIEPEIDIVGTVPIRDWKIQILISGTPEDLVLKLSCEDQAFDDQDLLSLLIFGKTTAELQGGIGAVAGGQSNEQMLASLVASTFGGGIKKAAGLDMLKVETGEENGEESDRIAVTVGKQFTKRLGTKYTIESKDSETLQRASAEFRILQNLLIEGFQEYYLTKTDDKGAYGGQIRFSWERR